MTSEAADSGVLPSSKLKVLAVSREKADKEMAERISRGTKMHHDLYTQYQKKYTLTQAAVEASRSEMRIWDDYNQDMFRTIFTVTSPYIKYITCASSVDRVLRGDSAYIHAENLLNWCRRKVVELKSIKERLPLFETAARLRGAKPAATKSVSVGNKVFIVHGHDESTKHQVARFLEGLDIEPVILDEKTAQGRVLIEKLEQESGIEVGYAVVLLTPDDEGKSKEETGELKLRARQNVILELGYFIGKLGRSRVCPLAVADVEIPSDYHGVEYIPLDAAGGWKLKLANELEDAGYKINRSGLK